MDYSFQNYDSKNMARAMAVGIPISRKQGVEICNFIRHRPLIKAKEILQGVIEKRTAIPFRRFNDNLGHKKKIGPARYPIKASKEILRLIEDVEANAQFKGLNSANLFIRDISVNQGPRTWHFGRKTRTKMKRTHVGIVVEERAKND